MCFYLIRFILVTVLNEAIVEKKKKGQLDNVVCTQTQIYKLYKFTK